MCVYLFPNDHFSLISFVQTETVLVWPNTAAGSPTSSLVIIFLPIHGSGNLL